jgi:hypothetical protein
MNNYLLNYTVIYEFELKFSMELYSTPQIKVKYRQNTTTKHQKLVAS